MVCKNFVAEQKSLRQLVIALGIELQLCYHVNPLVRNPIADTHHRWRRVQQLSMAATTSAVGIFAQSFSFCNKMFKRDLKIQNNA